MLNNNVRWDRSTQILTNLNFTYDLQVGYRSTLRASQSISDLSHSANADSSLRSGGAHRIQRQGKITWTVLLYGQTIINRAKNQNVCNDSLRFARNFASRYPPMFALQSENTFETYINKSVLVTCPGFILFEQILVPSGTTHSCPPLSQ